MLDANNFTQLARCVEAIGDDSFPGEISRFCAGISGAERVLLSAFFDTEKPALLYANHTKQDEKSALALYLDVAYVLDPFFHLFQQKQGDQVVRLREVAPDDFRRSEYYQKFYAAFHLRDEYGLMVHIDDGAAVFFSFGVQSAEGKSNSARLQMALPLIAALVRRHWTVLSPQKTDGSGRLATHLEAAFEAFGSSLLSPREGEILKLILKGHSSKSIARIFDNSPETIKVHRKRTYTKLGVTSQGELLSLFLRSLSQMRPTDTGDPLAYLSDEAP